MADPGPPSPVDELPEALPDRRRRVRLPFVWILPAIAIVAGALGFGGLAATAGSIAHILFVVFLVFFVIALIGGLMARRGPPI